MQKQQSHEQQAPDWKLKLRRQIYQTNKRHMREHRQKHKQRLREINECKDDQLPELKNQKIYVNENDLPSYPLHEGVDNYLPLEHQVYTKSDIQCFLPLEYFASKKQEIEQDILVLLKRAQKDCKIDKIWQHIIEKYTCPLDVLEKIEIYFECLRSNTSILNQSMLINCPNINPSIFLDSILAVKNYLKPSVRGKPQPHFKDLLQTKFCKVCQTYLCVKHSQSKGQRDLNRESKDEKHLLSYCLLFGQLNNLLFHDTRSQETIACSLQCFRFLSKESFSERLLEFTKPDLGLIKDIQMCVQIVGYDPCQISKMIKNVNCSAVVHYLILSKCSSAFLHSGRVSEQQRLKNIQKEASSVQIQGCICSKGRCKSNKCACFISQSQCNPQRCLGCFSKRFNADDKCSNKEITMCVLPRVKLSQSEQIASSLGLFTIDPIQKDSLVFWATGQILTKNEYELRRQLGKTQKQSGHFISDNKYLSYQRLGGKERFLSSFDSEHANVKTLIKKVQNQNYLCFYASKDIQEDQELKICNSKDMG